MSTMEHIHYLAEEIGPRGSTRSQEEKAARYAGDTLRAAGLEPITEPFTSARSAWLPYTLAFGLILVGVVLFWIGGEWGTVTALVITGVVLASVLLELAFRPNPLRWVLPKGESQNVWTRVEPGGDVREQVVVLAHLDSHRTPLVFSTDAWVGLFSVLIPVGLASVVILAGLLVAGLFWPRPLWQILSLPPGVVILAICLLTLQADRSPYTVGANDNASGVGVTLSLARRLAEHPLEHTQVWFVLSGCEEVGCYGADSFVQARGDDLVGPIWLTIDTVGGRGADPTWLEQETFLLTARSDADLLTLADGIARHHPDLRARATAFRGAYTEGAIGAKHGFRVLTLVALPQEGALPHWHRASDMVGNVDADVVARSREFVWELLREIDRAQHDRRPVDGQAT